MAWSKKAQREHRKELAEELCSDKYTKVEGRLRKKEAGPYHMCVLGVACDVSGLGRWLGDGYVVGDQDYGEGPFHSDLPESVREYYGLATSEGDMEHEECSSLLSANDEGFEVEVWEYGEYGLENRPVSFEEMSRIILDEPEGLLA